MTDDRGKDYLAKMRKPLILTRHDEAILAELLGVDRHDRRRREQAEFVRDTYEDDVRQSLDDD